MIPLPGRLVKWLMAVGAIFFVDRWLMTACANGCSDCFSRVKRICRMSVSAMSSLGKVCRASTAGLPWVRVPVLSNTMSVSLLANSSAWASFTRMPCLAPLPMPTVRAVGVASPSAQGQAMMSTLMNVVRAKAAGLLSGKRVQNRAEAMARMTTVGTKILDMRSASCCICGLEPRACSTRATICDSRVWLPTFWAMILRVPSWLMLPAKTWLPLVLAAGMGSPVMADSSMWELPERTLPSMGMRSPGLMMTKSPSRISAASTVISWLFRMTVAWEGCSERRSLMACALRFLARSSRYFPRRIRVMMTVADSK